MEVIEIGPDGQTVFEAGGPPRLVVSAIRNNRGWLIRADNPDDTLTGMLAECRRLEETAGLVKVTRRSRRGAKLDKGAG